MTSGLSPQALTEADRRIVAGWAADCADHVQALVQAELPGEPLSADAIARARAYSRGELDSAGEIRRRFVAFRIPKTLSPAASAAARSAAQAAGVAHMGAHALGAAAYAVRAIALSSPDKPDAAEAELRWQLDHLSPAARSALRSLPRAGENSSGPLGAGLLTSGELGAVIRRIQSQL